MFVVPRVIGVTIVLFLCFVVAGALVRPEGSAQTSDQAAAAALPLLTVCFLQAAVLTHVILRSRWSGWPLMAAVFFVFYGVATFMGQIESAVFITRLPAGILPRLFLMGVVVAAPFSVLAVLILGKRKRSAGDVPGTSRLVRPAREWVWKLVVLAVIYVVLYFTFGYFIAWRNPAVREYYAGIDEGTFLTHMASVIRETPWLIPFQGLRALCWVVLALPVIRMLKGGRLETAVAIGLLFGVVMNAQLLLPNPYMPEAVRTAHLVETASSNFIFGMLVGWLLTNDSAPRPIADSGLQSRSVPVRD